MSKDCNKNPNNDEMSPCHQCMGGEDVVKQVRNCTSTGCALYPVRPYK